MGAPPNTACTAGLVSRKAAALEQWAKPPAPYGTTHVRREAERTRAAATNAWQMHYNRQRRLADHSAGNAETATRPREVHDPTQR